MKKFPVHSQTKIDAHVLSAEEKNGFGKPPILEKKDTPFLKLKYQKKKKSF